MAQYGHFFGLIWKQILDILGIWGILGILTWDGFCPGEGAAVAWVFWSPVNAMSQKGWKVVECLFLSFLIPLFYL